MATLAQTAAIAGDSVFQSQVRIVAINFAHTVIKETPVTPDRIAQKRFALAVAIISNGCQDQAPNLILARLAWGLASYPGAGPFTANDSTGANDAALASLIQTAWNDLSLVTGEDTSA